MVYRESAYVSGLYNISLLHYCILDLLLILIWQTSALSLESWIYDRPDILWLAPGHEARKGKELFLIAGCPLIRRIACLHGRIDGCATGPLCYSQSWSYPFKYRTRKGLYMSYAIGIGILLGINKIWELYEDQRHS